MGFWLGLGVLQAVNIIVNICVSRFSVMKDKKFSQLYLRGGSSRVPQFFFKFDIFFLTRAALSVPCLTRIFGSEKLLTVLKKLLEKFKI